MLPKPHRPVILAALVLALMLLAPSASSASSWWSPPQHLTWYWQLQGTVPDTVQAEAYDVDGFETSASQVAALHAHGRHVICYIDVGTAEKFRPDYNEFPKSVLGRSNGWPGEKWIDIRKLSVIEPDHAGALPHVRRKGL